jgi:hypothetical protein
MMPESPRVRIEIRSILSDDGLIQTVKATDSSTGSPERFIRLKITPQ